MLGPELRKQRIDPLVFLLARWRKRAATVLGHYWSIVCAPRDSGTKWIGNPKSHALVTALRHLSLIFVGFAALNSCAEYLDSSQKGATSQTALWLIILISITPAALTLWALTKTHGATLSQTTLIYLNTYIIILIAVFPVTVVFRILGYATSTQIDEILKFVNMLIGLVLMFHVAPRLLQGTIGYINASYWAMILVANVVASFFIVMVANYFSLPSIF